MSPKPANFNRAMPAELLHNRHLEEGRGYDFINFTPPHQAGLESLAPSQLKQIVEEKYFAVLQKEAPRLSPQARQECLQLLQELDAIVSDLLVKHPPLKGGLTEESFLQQLMEAKAVILTGGNLSFWNAAKEKRWHELAFNSPLSVEELEELDRLTAERDIVEHNTQLPEHWQKVNYDQFIPELEVRKILSVTNRPGLSPEQRRQLRWEKLEEFKRQLNAQKQEIAFLIRKISHLAQEGSDEEDLIEVLYNYAKRGKLNNAQLVNFEQRIKRYMLVRRLISHYNRLYPQDEKLFEACFGRSPHGPVKVIRLSCAFYFKCYNIKDYAVVYCNIPPDKPITEEDIKRADLSGGVRLSHFGLLHPALEGCLMAEKVSDHQDNPAIYLHELQHFFYGFWSTDNASPRFEKESFMHLSLRQRREMVIGFLRHQRRYFEERAKNEILSFFKDGTRSFEISSHLFRPESEGGLYDYFAEWQRENYYTLDIIRKGVGNDWFQEKSRQIFQEEYQHTIHNALSAISQLKMFVSYRSDISDPDEFIITLLVNEPLHKWHRVVRSEIENQERSTSERLKRVYGALKEWIMECNTIGRWQAYYELAEFVERLVVLGEIKKEEVDSIIAEFWPILEEKIILH